jgi:DNA-binding HxlR family transcriptional regulator
VLNERLRQMMHFGILHRSASGEKPPFEVEYRLTPLGRRFRRLLAEVRRLQAEISKGGLRQ